MYRQHVRFEDELVCPLAARMLSDADKSAIADENGRTEKRQDRGRAILKAAR
jgi:hemerythrin-like domain-containing protein